MEKQEAVTKMIKEACKSGVIPKESEMETYLKIWDCFWRLYDIAKKPNKE